MKKYNVLVFPCGTEIANEVINSLKYHKYFRLVFASSEEKSYCNYRGQEVNFLPYASNANFTKEVNLLCKKKNIDFIVPAHDDVALKLSTIENEINAKVIGQNQFINEIVRFKDVTYNYFQDILPIAKIYKTIPLEEEFPVFVKPIRGQGSQNAVLLNTILEYDNFFTKFNKEEFIVMEYLDGDEFTIDCFSDNGTVLYVGARTREKSTRGISVQSTYVNDQKLVAEFNRYASIISKKLEMHGIWFYQMKYDKNNNLKLLEIGPRVSGTMMLNRARGVNFIELALYQKLGYPVEVICNDIEISLARSLVPIYKHNIEYNHLYIDFDDTLYVDEKYINSDIVKLIIDAKNRDKKVFLITKNKKNNLVTVLHRYGLTHLFDEIIHLTDNDSKIEHMAEKSLLIDDSFTERKEAIEAGYFAYSIDNIDVFLR